MNTNLIDKTTGEIKQLALRPIVDAFRHLRGGLMLDEAGEGLAEVVRAVEETGRGGKLIIELSIKPAGKTGALSITDKITAKVPQGERLDTLMYATPEGNLVTEHPKQNKLDLKSVEIPSAAALAAGKAA